ncbi:MAG: ABC transporter ATP-binding protein, partial [Nitriliruptoraceae bacterium]
MSRELVRPLRAQLAVATTLLVAATALTLAGPAILGRVVDAATAGRSGALLPLTLLFAAVMIAGAGLTWVGAVRVARVGEELLRKVRLAVFDRTVG